jgi:GTP-binding protein
MIKVNNAKYVLTAVKPDQYPKPPLPAIVLLGRSNVGKSSLINTLARRHSLARVGASPGKTRTINFYSLTEGWYLVDLPGYGYAKVAQTERAAWHRMIETFMAKYEGQKFYLQLVDIRHEPSALDREMWELLVASGEPCGIIATKADKLSGNQRQKSLSVIAKTLAVPKDEILVFSSVSGLGREDLLAAIEGCLEALTTDPEINE